jgi:hypothetical protein
MNAFHSDLMNELSPGEKLLWSGKPRDGFMFRASDIFTIPFSLFFLGFAAFWTLAVGSGILESYSRGEAPLFAFIFPLCGIPFVAMGLYILLGRFWVEKALRARTSYGVTNERAIIVSGLFSRTVKSLNLSALPDVSMSERRDGSGTISFGQPNSMYAFFEGMSWWPGFRQHHLPTFDRISNVKSVYKIIRDRQK